MSGENEVVVVEEEVVTTDTPGVQPRNTTEMTWPAFEDRWASTILNKLVKDLQKANDNIRATSIEFNMQQLVNAQNYVGQAIGELQKCIGYEQNNLVSAIGPRPKSATTEEESPVEEVVPESVPVEPVPETTSPFKPTL